MSTFTDMNQLLLTFFVLLLSMSTMDTRKIKVALGSLQGSLGILKSGTQTEMTKDDIMSRVSFVQSVQAMKLKISNSLKDYIGKANLSQTVTVTDTKKGINVRVMDSTMFQAGSADIREDSKPLLDKLAAVVAETPFDVMVEGHTDDTPFSTAVYPSNWELSTARAVNVVKYFISKGVNPQKLSAAGYGDNHPVVPNINAASRAKNRRVEINFISPELAETNKNTFDEEDNKAAEQTRGGGGQ